MEIKVNVFLSENIVSKTTFLPKNAVFMIINSLFSPISWKKNIFWKKTFFKINFSSLIIKLNGSKNWLVFSWSEQTHKWISSFSIALIHASGTCLSLYMYIWIKIISHTLCAWNIDCVECVMSTLLCYPMPCVIRSIITWSCFAGSHWSTKRLHSELLPITNSIPHCLLRAKKGN